MNSMSSTASAPPRTTEESVRECELLEKMIELNVQHLEALRSERARDLTASPNTNAKNTSTYGSSYASEITKQQHRNIEAKLIKYFAKQLEHRFSHTTGGGTIEPQLLQYPSLARWLAVVGVSAESNEAILKSVESFDALRDKSETELNCLLVGGAPKLSAVQRQEDLRRLNRALLNLRKYTDDLLHGPGAGARSKLELYWDSWLSSGALKSKATATTEYSPPPVSAWKDDMAASSPLPPLTPTGATNSSGTNTSGSILRSRNDSSVSSSSSGSSIPPPSPGMVSFSPSALLTSSQASTGDHAPRSTPPTTPPWSALFGVGASGANATQKQVQKFPTTPPPNKKHSITNISVKSDYPLIKSKSHECELGNRINPSLVAVDMTSGAEGDSTVEEAPVLSQHQKHMISEPAMNADYDCVEPSLPSPSPLASPCALDDSLTSFNSMISSSSMSSTLQVPKSPRTPRSMGHSIKHRFKKTMKPSRCDYCSEFIIKLNGLKCKECKFRCHRDCEPKVPPSCCLPEDLIDYYVNHLTKEGSPILPGRMVAGPSSDFGFSRYGQSSDGIGSFHGVSNPSSTLMHIPGPYPDSSSTTSSCNSSTPSSPAVMVTSAPTPPHSASIYSSSTRGSKFTFPDPPVTLRLEPSPMLSAAASTTPRVMSPNPIIDSVKSYDSDKTLSGTSGSSSSAGTAYRLDSQDSTAEDNMASTWNAGRQPSVSLREWDIPYEELVISDKIGSGRFSTVFQGNWHGDVAIKILNMENLDDEATLEAFRLDVATFRKTRHENLILFMGACTIPPKLAIVMGLCKGNTLYTHLHLWKDSFSMNKNVIIAQQIAQGMGYLHHRGIVHKDLKTKNIFLENGRAIISDFGLVNVARRLCARSYVGLGSLTSQMEKMSIPKGWLCYLAPEIMQALHVYPDEGEDLPFTKSSDVFAFGTVWYELLSREWPWRELTPEAIIWQVGKGMKPSLHYPQWTNDVKDILMSCWNSYPQGRPDFPTLSVMLESIPKKKNALNRSPSHPVHLSRSSSR